MEKSKLSRRQFLGLAAAAAGASMALAACAPAAQPTAAPAAEATTAPAAEATKAPAATAVPASSGEKVNLRFIKLSMSDPVSSYFNDTAIPGFQKANPNMTVTVDMSDWDHLGEKLMTSFAGNLPVDLIETGSDWVGPYAKRKQFLPIDDYISKDYQDEIGDFYKDMVDISVYQGQLMGLPYILDIRTMTYRKDQFQEVGLDPEKPPQTWDDLVAYATKLVQRDSSGNITRAGYMASCGTPGDAFFEYWYHLVENGSNFIVPWGSWDTKDIKINSPEGVEALQFLYDLINKYKVTPLTGMTSKNPDLSPVAAGVASMAFNGSWEIGNWRQYQPDKIANLGIGVPLMKKTRKNYVCPNVYTIGSNTKHPDQAWALMKYMVSKDVMTGMLSPDASSPPRKSIAADADYMKDPMLQAFQAIPDKGWGTTTPQAMDAPMNYIVGNYVQAALRDQMTIQAALDKAAADVAQKIEESAQSQQ